MTGVAITLGAVALAAASWWATSAVLSFCDAAVLDPLLPVAVVFIVLSLVERGLARRAGPHS